MVRLIEHLYAYAEVYSVVLAWLVVPLAFFLTYRRLISRLESPFAGTTGNRGNNISESSLGQRSVAPNGEGASASAGIQSEMQNTSPRKRV